VPAERAFLFLNWGSSRLGGRLGFGFSLLLGQPPQPGRFLKFLRFSPYFFLLVSFVGADQTKRVYSPSFLNRCLSWPSGQHCLAATPQKRQFFLGKTKSFLRLFGTFPSPSCFKKRFFFF